MKLNKKNSGNILFLERKLFTLCKGRYMIKIIKSIKQTETGNFLNQLEKKNAQIFLKNTQIALKFVTHQLWSHCSQIYFIITANKFQRSLLLV